MLFYLLLAFQCLPTAFGQDLLIQSHAVFRHGDRAPTTIFTSEEARRHFYRGLGQLSDEGIKHAAALGRALKTRTVDLGLLDRRMLPDEIKFRSSAVPRCLISAEAVGGAMFDQIDSMTPSYVPVHTTTKELDFLCVPQTSSKMLEDLRIAAGTNNSNATVMESLAVFADELCNKSKYFSDPQKAYMLEALPIERAAGLAVPSWFNASAEEEALLINYKALAFIAGVGEYLNKEFIKCRTGLLLDKILKDMNFGIKCSSKNSTYTKFYTYSTHDFMVMPIMESLGLMTPVLGQANPPFSGCILLELWQSNNAFVVKAFWFGETSSLVDVSHYLRGCINTSSCPLETLSNSVADFVLKDKKDCGFGEPASSPANMSSFLITYIASLIVVLMR